MSSLLPLPEAEKLTPDPSHANPKNEPCKRHARAFHVRLTGGAKNKQSTMDVSICSEEEDKLAFASHCTDF
jgi:hypothetical protein